MWPEVELNPCGIAPGCFFYFYERPHVVVHSRVVVHSLSNIGVANSKKAIAWPRRLTFNKYAVTSPAINEGDLVARSDYRTPL